MYKFRKPPWTALDCINGSNCPSLVKALGNDAVDVDVDACH